MSSPSSTYTLRTLFPSGPVWGVFKIIPNIREAISLASAGDFASLTPPAFPRPPACTWALTTTTFVPIARAACSASSGLNTRYPRGTGTRYFRRISFA